MNDRNRVSCVLAVCFFCPLLVERSSAQLFRNLGFEETLYPVDSSGAFLSPDSCGTGVCQEVNDSFDPAVVTPGWRLGVEWLDGSEPDLPYVVNGVLLPPGHIGGTTNFYLSDYQFPAGNSNPPPFGGGLLGNHSLVMRAGDSVDRATNPYAYFDEPSPGDGIGYNVVSQTGLIPEDAKSVYMLVDSAAFGEYTGGTAEFFSVRFDGFEVEMHMIESPGTSHVGGHYFAGNIEPIAGWVSELSIRLEKPTPSFNGVYYEIPELTLDDVTFSVLAAPGPPIKIPEPNTAIVACLLGLMIGRLRR